MADVIRCPRCAQVLPDRAAFCRRCGAALPHANPIGLQYARPINRRRPMRGLGPRVVLPLVALAFLVVRYLAHDIALTSGSNGWRGSMPNSQRNIILPAPPPPAPMYPQRFSPYPYSR